MSATDHLPKSSPRGDWFAQPIAAFLLWCVPLAIGFSASLLLPPRTAALAWMVAFVWMGAGCTLNAYRCHRLHCYISAPVFFIGAVTQGLLAANVLSLGPQAANNIVGATLLLVLLSFVPERIWGKYA